MEVDDNPNFGGFKVEADFEFDNFGQTERCVLRQFADSLNEEGAKVLNGRCMSVGRGVKSPLGCTFDEGTKKWLVCGTGNDSLMEFSEDVHNSRSVDPSLKSTSSVVITNPGRSYGVLCKSGIMVGDLRSRSIIRLSQDSRFEYRGLAQTMCGRYLMTVSQGKMPLLEFFDVRRTASEPVSVAQYSDHCSSYGWPRPSFIDCYEELLLVSDLGRAMGEVRGFNVMNVKKPFEVAVKPCLGPSSSAVNYNFKFPAGMFIDGRGEFLVMDAAAVKLLWFDKEAKFRGSVKFDDEFVYASDIHVNRKGNLLVCARRNNCVKLYQLC